MLSRLRIPLQIKAGRIAFLACAALPAACSSGGAATNPPSSKTAAPPPSSNSPSDPTDDTPDPRLANRPYDVYVPASYEAEKPAALVLAFHGYGSGDNGPLLESYFKFKPIADAQGFLYVTPNGTKDSTGQQFWNATDACCDFEETHVDDVGYVKAIVADVAKHYNLDAKRVYGIGLSAGGFFAHRLACDAADVFAALVSQSGATYDDASKCKPSASVALVEIHGDADDTVSYDGGPAAIGGFDAPYPSAHDTVAHWAGYESCPGALADTGQTLDLFKMAGSETQVSRYDGCASAGGGAADVELWTVKGGVHAPAYAPGFAQSIWDYFSAHPKP